MYNFYIRSRYGSSLVVASTIDERYTLPTIYTMNRRRQLGGGMVDCLLYCIVIVLAHLLSGISHVIYFYLPGERVWCQVVFIRILIYVLVLWDLLQSRENCF